MNGFGLVLDKIFQIDKLVFIHFFQYIKYANTFSRVKKYLCRPPTSKLVCLSPKNMVLIIILFICFLFLINVDKPNVKLPRF